jgi:hypothetical protein
LLPSPYDRPAATHTPPTSKNKFISINTWNEALQVYLSVYINRAQSLRQAKQVIKDNLTYANHINMMAKQKLPWYNYDRQFRFDRIIQPYTRSQYKINPRKHKYHPVTPMNRDRLKTPSRAHSYLTTKITYLVQVFTNGLHLGHQGQVTMTDPPNDPYLHQHPTIARLKILKEPSFHPLTYARSQHPAPTASFTTSVGLMTIHT